MLRGLFEAGPESFRGSFLCHSVFEAHRALNAHFEEEESPARAKGLGGLSDSPSHTGQGGLDRKLGLSVILCEPPARDE